MMKKRIVNLFKSNSGIWALSNQGVVSLGTFITNIFLARHLVDKDYGVYSLLMGVILFLNGLHAALITYPLSVKGAKETEEKIRSTALISIYFTVLLNFPILIIMIVYGMFSNFNNTFLFGGLFLIFWQVQETVRRSMMAHLKFKQAILGDSISYLGQVILLFVLSQISLLSLKNVFISMSLTSLLAALVQVIQLRLPIKLLKIKVSIMKNYWNIGKWVLATNLVSLLLIQLFPWSLAYFNGPEATAAYQAIANLLGVTHPIMFSIGSIIIPAIAKAQEVKSDYKEIYKSVSTYVFQGSLLLIPYYLLLIIFPKQLLALFYGSESIYVEYYFALRIFVCAYVFNFIGQVLISILKGLEESRNSFRAQYISGVFSGIFGLPLIMFFGVMGASAGMLIAHISRAFLCILFLRRVMVE